MADEMKKYIIELLNVDKVGEDYYLFDFSVPKELVFKEGQYGVFMHVNKEIEGRKVRAFSIASSNSEKVFKVGTKITRNPSDFKKKMLELKIGDTMTFTGPMGDFILNLEHHSVFIAGGIGITPIRGIIKQMEAININKEAVLIYSEPRSVYPYQDDFDKIVFLDNYYKNGIDNTKVAIDEVSLKYLNNAIYYVAGSPGFVKGIKEQLINNKIDITKILFDRFPGY